MRALSEFNLDTLDFTRGLITVVCQDARTGMVLMVAHADREALERTILTGEMHYRSRTRGLWHKGATSGNVQRVMSLATDCDGDAVLARVVPAGPACHAGTRSCFGDDVHADAIGRLGAVVAHRVAQPSEGSYTNRLLADRNLRLKKLGEETAELIAACADGDSSKATEEAADLVYHAIVALVAAGSTVAELQACLSARSGDSPLPFLPNAP